MFLFLPYRTFNQKIPHFFLCRINENDLFKHDWRSRSKVQVLQYIFLKWTVAFLVGLLTGIIATLINLAVENIAGYKLLAVVGYIEKERCCYMRALNKDKPVKNCDLFC